MNILILAHGLFAIYILVASLIGTHKGNKTMLYTYAILMILVFFLEFAEFLI